MANPTINIDSSSTLDIVGVRAGNFFQIVFELFYDDGITEKPFEGNYRLDVFSDYTRNKRVLTIDESTGISKSANVLTITATDGVNVLKAGNYYYHIFNHVDSSTTYSEFNGGFSVT